MKKIISWVITLSWLAIICVQSSGSTLVYAQAENSHSELLTFMYNLSLINEDFDKDTELTKSAMASLFCGFFEDDLYDYSSSVFFSDVNSETENSFNINKATANGIFASTVPVTKFCPDNIVSIDDIAEKCIELLGYGTIISKDEYLDKASELGLYKGVKTENSDMINALIVIKNALDENIVEVNYGNKITYTISDDKTLLSKALNVYSFKGRIKAIAENALVDEYATAYGEIRIGDYVLNLSEQIKTYALDNIGLNVRAYYQEKDDEYTLVHFDLMKDQYVEFELSKYFGIENNEIKYEDENGRTKRLKVDPYAYIIYNNKPVKQLPVLGKYGTMKVISSDNNNCNILIIKEYSDYIFEEYNQDRKYIVLKGNNRVIELEDCKEIIVYTDNLREIKLEEIKKGSVISVIKNGESIEIVVSEKSKYGNVKAVYTENSRCYIKIENEEYEFDKIVNNADLLTTDINSIVGNEIDIYLDIFGRVAGFSLSKDNDLVGYLIWVKYDDEYDQVNAKIFNSLGQFETLKVRTKKNRIKVGGNLVDYNYFIDDHKDASTGRFLSTIIQYRVNKNGEIIDINMPLSTPSEDLFLKYDLTNEVRFRTGINSFGAYALLKPDAKVFIVPEPENSDDITKYRVVSTTFFNADQRYNGIKFYGTSKNDIAVSYAVYEEKGTEVTGSTMIVTDIYQTINADYELITVINGITYGNENAEFIGAPGIALEVATVSGSEVTIEEGDIIRGRYSRAYGEYTSVELLYDASSRNPWTLATPLFSLDENNSICVGTVNNLYDDYLEVVLDDGSIRCYNISSTLFYVVEGNKWMSVEKAKATDMKKGLSKIVFYDNAARCRWVAIYN